VWITVRGTQQADDVQLKVRARTIGKNNIPSDIENLSKFSRMPSTLPNVETKNPTLSHNDM